MEVVGHVGVSPVRGRGRERGWKTWNECEVDYGPTLFEAGMGSEQRCVEGFNMGQTSNPSLAWKK